ncbi:uncharacterized protein Z518_00420 [Rhinocladiella mackenziei CBS 650.93]|uniref:SGT1 and CS domain protein n=1 Tax=Rhinocladiella mackenziei CBS 650.93 TaxID=1442369 RepID=A0A0D2J0W6_9EURO|nr:uncharacterized protein Z518_00420 [Rhinocladiella mackenziei CBS 650.93]KIX09341.1 hypothetical protein Z518_00420 [Rhinocladiella mackenziei CBS 650.93]
MDQAQRGANALAASDYPGALAAYTQALIEHPTSPDYFTKRSLVFTRLKPARYDLALRDAEYAVLLARKRARRELIQAAQQRRVIALHGLGRYADAKFLLSTMERWVPKESRPAKMEIDMWKAKVESKLQNVPESEKVATVKEYPEIELPTDAKMTEKLEAQLNADGSFKLDQDSNGKSSDPSTILAGALPSTNGTDGTANGEASAAAPKPTTDPVPTQIRHEWYQNAQSVTLTLYAKGVSKDAAQIDINEDSVYVSFPHPSNPSTSFTFALDPLFAPIDPSRSKSAVLSTKVELTLTKAQAGQKWHTLEGSAPLKPSNNTSSATNEDAARVAVMDTLNQKQSESSTKPTASAPSYPTSSRHGPKDWDKLANDLHAQSKAKRVVKKSDNTNEADEEEDIDSDYEGGDAVDGFFKKLYAGADDDTRRAMMKSYYESNGTALSTNWAEVGKGKVEEVKGKDD